jgi:flagellar biosynthesis protein FlhA
MNFADKLKHINTKTLAAPIIVIMMMAMMILPIPSFVLDIFFTVNISLSIIVLLTALYTVSPLDFMVFPAVLLITTMLRLSLNVASTRIVLTEGHNGPDAAGKVIEAFGHFLIGGNYLVGCVIFIILTIINFVVVTKGAGRIAEVGARFALDAMPGKQMAIDADLNSGLIGEEDAKLRRKQVSQEAEFYGAMDGASKYVRGDAVSGIIIVVINMIGGLIVGMIQHELDFNKALETYTLLAIGDGLIAQIPSLLISVAAGVVVSRVASEQDLGTQFVTQLLVKAQILYITAGIVGGLGIIPGMPHLAFGMLALIIAGGAYKFQHKKQEGSITEVVTPKFISPEMEEVTWQDVAPIQTLSLEVGYRLISLVNEMQDGELLRRIKGVRRKFAQEIGFLPPLVHINDNLELKPSAYKISLKGVEIGIGESYPGKLLAINPGMVAGPLDGTQVTDPAFGLPAIWIESDLNEQAQALGYTVVNASTVIATHLNHLMVTNAADLLSRQEIQALLEHIGKQAPKLIEDLIPKLLPLSIFQKVLQNLLIEEVNIRDMNTIIETVYDYAQQTQDPTLLTTMVRIALGRAIVQQIFPSERELPIMALENQLEQLLLQAMHTNGTEGEGIEPSLAETLASQTALATKKQEQLGYIPVLLVPSPIRFMLARFLRKTLPQLKVLSHAELPNSYSIKVTNLVGSLT